MKKDIHPAYYANARIACGCGNVVEVGSTKKDTVVEICGACHPFYTGKEKLIDAAGRVEKFKAKAEKAKKAGPKKRAGKTRK